MYKILADFDLYSDLLNSLTIFLKENTNLNNLKEEELLYLEIIDYYLTDKVAINNEMQRNYILENLSKKIIEENDLLTKINEINISSKESGYPIHLSINQENELEFKYTKRERISIHKKIEKVYCSKFALDSLDNHIKKITADDLFSNLDDQIYRSIIYTKIKDYNMITDLIPCLKKAILNITNSLAMKKFFENTYKLHYKNLKYDFDKKEVIDKFFERIRIIPIFKGVDAFSDPMNLKIYLPSNPGEIEKLNYLVEIKALRFGRYLILIIHELLGHLMRRYYNYLTNGRIPQNSPDDKKMNFDEEGGYYIEKHLLGRELGYISMKDIFSLLICGDDYPLIDYKKLTLDNIKIVIKEYPYLFDFISFDKGETDFNKIFINDYYNYLMIPPLSITKSKMYSHTSFISIK